MRTLFLNIWMIIFSTTLLAQFPKLDVAGDSKIIGWLDLLKGTGNTLAGFEAGKITSGLARYDTYFGTRPGFLM